MTKVGQNLFSSQEIMAQLRDMQSQAKVKADAASGSGESSGPSFLDHLREGVQEVNNMQTSADKMAIDLSSGKSDAIHETMLAATQAELSFNLMVQIRNKILEAYQEVMRMQI